MSIAEPASGSDLFFQDSIAVFANSYVLLSKNDLIFGTHGDGGPSNCRLSTTETQNRLLGIHGDGEEGYPERKVYWLIMPKLERSMDNRMFHV